jgi:hypothetical protein
VGLELVEIWQEMFFEAFDDGFALCLADSSFEVLVDAKPDEYFNELEADQGFVRR